MKGRTRKIWRKREKGIKIKQENHNHWKIEMDDEDIKEAVNMSKALHFLLKMRGNTTYSNSIE